MELNLNLSDEDEIVEDTSRAGEQTGELGSVLVAIASMKDHMNSILQNQVSEMLKEQSALKAITTETSTELKSVLKSIKDKISVPEIHDAKTKRLSSMSLQHLSYAVGPERAVVSLLTWAIICTVMSYVRAMPSLRFWVSDAMWTKMAPHADVLDRSQGIAMLLFAVRNNSKAKLATPPGRIWAFLMRRALRSGIIYAKANLFQRCDSAVPVSPASRRTETVGIPTSSVSAADPSRPGGLPDEPQWMTRFSNNSDIVRAVEDAMQKFEGTSSELNASSAPADSLSEGPSSRLRKRKKSSSGAGWSDHELRMHVVKHIRSLWLEKMNQGRTAVRAYLYKKFIFILDKISQIKSVETAAQKGYKIVLGRESSAAEVIDKEMHNLQDGIWNIPDAHSKGTLNADKKNHDLFRRLKEDFPSLHAKIVYKKHVKTDTNEVDLDAELVRSNREYLSLTEEISFHEIAKEMLMEIFACETSGAVLLVSQLSLKATHVLAIALRGLVVSVLSKYRPTHCSLSEMESAAFGEDVTLDDEKEVAVMIERFLKNGRGKLTDTYATCYREKFTISQDDAKELRKVIEAQKEAIAAEDSGQPFSVSTEGGEEIGPEDWIHQK